MWREYVRIALRALRAHKFRSALTVSSITLGAFSIVLMSSLADSGLTTLVSEIEQMGGARILMIAPKQPERVPNRQHASPGELTRKDRDLLFSAVPHTVGRAMYGTLDRTDVIDDLGVNARSDLVVADAGFFAMLNLEVEKGRAFSDEEEQQHARVCVLGHGIAKKLYDGKPVGRWVTIGKDRCQVIGQLTKVEHWDINFGFDWLDFVVMPLETAADTRPEVRGAAFIQFKTDDLANNDIAKRIANAIMVDRHRGVDDFEIWDFNAFMTQLQKIFTAMQAIVGLIAGIALIVGGIGIMNMMLVSVSERTREIGIRKALGASPGAIASQFLCEAAVLSGTGGLVGTAAGVVFAIAASILIHSLQPLWIGVISWPAVVIALSASLLIGVGFGFFPARRAGRLDPVEAIRR